MDAVSRYADLIGSIESRLDRGASLEAVDSDIQQLSLAADERDALSLYAWAWRETGPHQALEITSS